MLVVVGTPDGIFQALAGTGINLAHDPKPLVSVVFRVLTAHQDFIGRRGKGSGVTADKPPDGAVRTNSTYSSSISQNFMGSQNHTYFVGLMWR